MKLLGYEKSLGFDYILTIQYDRWLRKPLIIKYRGSSTVWRNADTGNRASTWVESALSDYHAKIKWDIQKDNAKKTDTICELTGRVIKVK